MDQNDGTMENQEDLNQTQNSENISEDQSQLEVTSTESQETPETQETELNTIGAALDAFEKVKSGAPLAVSQGAQGAQGVQGQHRARDYSGLDEVEIAWFKRMGNEAYANLYPRYLESKKHKETIDRLNKELEASRGAHFFEQDGAWTLMPEYRQIEQSVNRLNAEASHWQEQLRLIEEGQEWTPLVLDPQGNVVLGAPQPASTAAKAEIMGALNKAYSYAANAQNQLQAFQGQFKEKHSNFVKSLNGLREQIFKGADLTKLEKAAAPKLEMFPAHMRTRPEVRALAEALVLIEGLTAMVNTSRANKASMQIKSNIASAAGPNGSRVAQGSGKGETIGSVLNQFKKLKTGVA